MIRRIFTPLLSKTRTLVVVGVWSLFVHTCCRSFFGRDHVAGAVCPDDPVTRRPALTGPLGGSSWLSPPRNPEISVARATSPGFPVSRSLLVGPASTSPGLPGRPGGSSATCPEVPSHPRSVSLSPSVASPPPRVSRPPRSSPEDPSTAPKCPGSRRRTFPVPSRISWSPCVSHSSFPRLPVAPGTPLRTSPLLTRPLRDSPAGRSPAFPECPGARGLRASRAGLAIGNGRTKHQCAARPRGLRRI